MADITKYPNPLRLFSQTRDRWLVDLIESYDIPMHIFTAVRDSQLGQLMFAVESVKRKRRRAGDEDGPDFLDEENAAAFIQVFSIIKQFQEFIEHEDINIELKKLSDLKKHETYKQFESLKRNEQEWFSLLSEDRLDELFLASVDVITAILSRVQEELELEEDTPILDKIGEYQANFQQVMDMLIHPEIVDAIREESYEYDEKDATTRVFTTTINQEEESEGEETQSVMITYNDYHGRVNLLYAVVLEFKRLFEQLEDYSFKYDNIEPLLTAEMLIMYPRPNKNFLPVIKDHLEVLAKSSSYPSKFWDIISINFQTFSHLEESNQRLLRKLYKNFERSMKEDARSFWKTTERLVGEKDHKGEDMIAVLWAHFRAVQTQAQHMEQQHGDHNHSASHSATIRMEHIFWVQARDFIGAEEMTSAYQFWSAYSFISNKQVRSNKDSLELFHELSELLQKTRVLTNKKQRKKLDVEERDQYTLLQRILSYGLEARTEDVFDEIGKYVDLLEKLLEEINVDEMHASFDLDQEKEVVDNIRTHLKNPLPQQS